MDMRTVLFMVLLYSSGQPILGEAGTMDDWIRLRDSLFSNYTKDIYPLHNFSDTLNIDISMFLLSIIDFDEVSGVITLSAGLMLNWNDYRLQWTPSEYGGIEAIQVNSTNVWTPKVYVLTAADDLRPFGSEEFSVDISYTGRLDYVPGKLLKSTCSVDMSKFPLDTQTCNMQVMLWRSPSTVKLTYNRTDFILTWYTTNGEWDITKTNVSYYMAYGSPSTTLDFMLQISRRHIYFIVSMTIPVLLLCFLNPFVFLLPSSSGERISYTITMFLSLTVYMTLIGDILPKVSENMAGMSYFLLLTLFYSGILIVLTIFTLRCEAAVDVKEFPRWLRRLTHYCCKTNENKVSNDTNLIKSFDLKNQKEDEVTGVVDIDAEFVDVQLKDVMQVIDKFLVFYAGAWIIKKLKGISEPLHQSRFLKMHAIETTHECGVCFKLFDEVSSLQIHLQTHLDQTPSICNVSGKGFDHPCILKDHLETNTVEKSYKCDICEKKFTRPYGLKVHYMTHTGERPYKCDICGETFKEPSALQIHLSVHTEELLCKCGVWWYIFPKTSPQSSHKRKAIQM
ncbi:acetylcholine receptor subunit alpha-like [Ylistrum balloti]|uniref:acetylcholine receptor subunit alpha-like n=1 Tax=Ylistrum balloti TaxID=509963 RepID=UPI002905886C|nr:acetylcholine receptor subunit alpha-like [Ylistrum balloti]